MRTTDSYSDLRRLGQPVVTTRDAAARWHKDQQVAGRRLRAMEGSGLVRRLRRGVWALDSDVEPFVVAPYLTAPFPAYVSFWSALAEHGMIEQIPRHISVASTARTQRITTPIADYQIHHLTPELLTGFEGSASTGYVATPEKALFDAVYIRAAAGSKAYFPELSLPAGFDEAVLKDLTNRVKSKRLRTLVSRQLRTTVRQAS
ncbi:MAG: type IV toxin-antitoxin system AbiEi family antitoxin domain-containing protein [Solirubrobacterales bacterium]